MPTDKLREALQAFKTGDKQSARRLVSEVLKAEPNNADAWYMAAYFTEDKEQRIQLLGCVLSINPGHTKARETLNKLRPPSFPDPLNEAINNLGATIPQPSPQRTASPGKSNSALLTLLVVMVVVVCLGLSAIGIYTQRNNIPVLAALFATATPTSTVSINQPTQNVILTDVPTNTAVVVKSAAQIAYGDELLNLCDSLNPSAPVQAALIAQATSKLTFIAAAMKSINEDYVKALPPDRHAKDKTDVTGLVCASESQTLSGTDNYQDSTGTIKYTCTRYQNVFDAFLFDVKSKGLAAYKQFIGPIPPECPDSTTKSMSTAGERPDSAAVAGWAQKPDLKAD